MALDVGSRLGHYDVTALIGEGGMVQVYQATDTKLNRQVALKLLPEAFASDSDRLARFQREAQVLASLNHPGIAAIYGLEEAEGTRALVLELVEAPTLADRIAQGPIPVDEALPIATQIAEALEAAHEAGVIHRDLKPANIKVREDGTVKVRLMRTTRQKRKERLHAMYRADVLEVARVLFSEKGYDATTMQAIADEAELAVGSLYNVFASKEALFNELAREFTQSFRLTLDRVFHEDTDALTMLENFVRVSGEFFQADRAMARFYFDETRMKGFTPANDPHTPNLRDDMQERLVATFNAGRDSGLFQFDDGDAYSLAYALQSLTSAFLGLWLRHPEGYPYPDSVEPVLAALFQGVLVQTPDRGPTRETGSLLRWPIRGQRSDGARRPADQPGAVEDGTSDNAGLRQSSTTGEEND